VAVLAGGVDVTADVQPVLGGVVAGEAAGYLLLGFQRVDAALADVVREPDPGVAAWTTRARPCCSGPPVTIRPVSPARQLAGCSGSSSCSPATPTAPRVLPALRRLDLRGDRPGQGHPLRQRRPCRRYPRSEQATRRTQRHRDVPHLGPGPRAGHRSHLRATPGGWGHRLALASSPLARAATTRERPSHSGTSPASVR
jgi:hypothetical protein